MSEKETKKAAEVEKKEEKTTAAEATKQTAETAKTAEKPSSTEEKEVTAQPVEFDWDSLTKKGEVLNPEEQKKLEELYTQTLTSIGEHEIVEGTVIAKTKKEVVVNINYKSEGVIPASEFRYNPDLKVGDKVEVYVVNPEDKNGQLVLSHQKARMLRAWERVNEAHDNNEIVKGYIKCRTKGGFIVDVFGLEAFLPGSQIDVKPIKDYDEYVGKTMDFKVVKINPEFKNVVVSHKALIEAEIEQQKLDIMSKLEQGQVLEGVVKNITSYGVFVDLGGVDGLIHITDLSWGRVNHPEEIVQLEEKIKVVILDFDEEKKRIALGLKQLQPHPWESLDPNLKVGDKVKGKVVVLADYGAFVEIQPGVEGLIHVTEMSWSNHLKTANDFFKVGDEVEAVIMTLDREERKMSLSTRRLTPDPWEDIEKKYPVDSKHKGKVTNISNFGVFVELEEGVDGLVHVSDLSWEKKINHPSEMVKVGDEMEVVVLEIDRDNRRLKLGHKQLQENPWEVFETVFTVGSVHEGTVIEETPKGFVVAMPYGLEAFCPARHGVKEDKSKISVDEKLPFQVIEFDKNDRKLFVSHTKIHQEKVEEEKKEKEKAKKSKAKKNAKVLKEINKNVEKTTLGDLDALAALKSEMEKKENKK